MAAAPAAPCTGCASQTCDNSDGSSHWLHWRTYPTAVATLTALSLLNLEILRYHWEALLQHSALTSLALEGCRFDPYMQSPSHPWPGVGSLPNLRRLVVIQDQPVGQREWPSLQVGGQPAGLGLPAGDCASMLCSRV